MRRRQTYGNKGFDNTVEVRGQSVPVTIDANGNFNVTFDGEDMRHQTLAGLKEKLSRVTAKKPLNVLVTKMSFGERWLSGNEDKIEFTDGVLTGIHSGNRNKIVKWDGEARAEQFKSYGQDLMRRLTGDERERLRELYATRLKAEAAFIEFKKGLALGEIKQEDGE